ncbi:hypothetical protein [Flammeovirga pacifica]|uniref:Uncharacterized protein n=1 Tax=Flammeovirga pacifica TaxID=915059 RepID=A0A1S1Z3Z4_FLAPC|nr:hypothetical protein [Flammeovirga pacifica]OHX68008.1 hypothetical protein NH26_17495 [Flammeovirga pacifica]
MKDINLPTFLSDHQFVSKNQFNAIKSDLIATIDSTESLNDQSNGVMFYLTHLDRYEEENNLIDLIYKYVSITGYEMPDKGIHMHRDLSIQHLRLLENVGEDSINNAFTSRQIEPLDETSYYLRVLAPLMLCEEIKDWEVYKWVALEIVNFSLENGINEITPYGCLGLARYMMTKYEDMHLANDYAKYALTEIEKSNNKLLINAFYSDYAFIILPWLKEISECTQLIEDKYQLIRESEDAYLKGKNIKRYYQMMLFSGMNKEEALAVSQGRLSVESFDQKPEISAILEMYQLSKMTQRVNLEKVIMLIDKSPELYEGNLLHPSLLVMKAVHINNQKINDEGGLRKVFDRFKYWAGYSPNLFDVLKHFVEAEWRLQRNEIEKSKSLYKQALDLSSSNKSDLNCLIALRRLAVFSDLHIDKNDLKVFYNEALSIYQEFGDQKAIESFLKRFPSI